MAEARTSKYSLGAVVFWFSFVAGISIWIASPHVTGQAEPLDSGGFYYLGTMLFTGLICGAIAPRRIWMSWIGMYAGQCFFTMMSNPKLGPLAPLGWFCFLPIYSLATLAGAALASVLRLTILASLDHKPVSENQASD